jgi:hypothetical protein
MLIPGLGRFFGEKSMGFAWESPKILGKCGEKP